MNRLSYDSCAYAQALAQSVSPMSYVMDPIKYEHCNKCRPELGIVGGTAVSHINGSLVDLENNLLGIDRPGTHCSAFKYAPPAPGQPLQGMEYIKPVQHPPIDLTLKHLPACQFASYPGVPQPPPMPRYTCGNY